MSKRRRKLAAGNRSTGGAKSSTRHDRQARAVSIRFPKFAKPLLALTGLVVAIFLGEVASRILRLAPAVKTDRGFHGNRLSTNVLPIPS